MKKLLYLTGFLSAVALATGIAFKMLHISGANQLFMVGYLGLFLIFIPIFAYDRYKSSKHEALPARLTILFGLIAAALAGLAGVFKMMHLQGADLVLMLGAAVFVLGFLPLFFFALYKKASA